MPAEQGASLAAISREAGLHKDWLCRHLKLLAPDAAAYETARRHEKWDARWHPVVAALGFADVAAYLTDAVAARFGFPAIEDYFESRRAAGMSWRASAAECDQPATWVRRRAGLT